MTRCAFKRGSIDAVASFYATGHVAAERHASLFLAIADWLRPGGLLLTSAPATVGNSYDPEWLGVPMFFGGIGATATREAIHQAGLAIESWETISEDEGHEDAVEFHWLMARKPLVE